MCDQDNEGGDDCLKVVTIMMRMVIDNISGNGVGIGVAVCDDDVILMMIEMVVGLTLKEGIIIFTAAMILLIMTMYCVAKDFARSC